MKTFKKLNYLTLLFIPLIFISCSSTFSLKNVETPDNEIYLDRGKAFQVVENSDVAISMYGKDVVSSDEAAVVVGVSNKSSVYDLDFNDSSINIYGGNVDTNQWNLINNWNANSYYNRAKSESNSRILFTALGGAFRIFNSGYYRSSYRSTYYSNGVSITTTYRGGSNVFVSSMIASNNMRYVIDNNNRTLSYLENNLLYPTTIKADNSYVGVLYFPVRNDYPDYRIVYSDYNNSDLNFYFNRSDRAEIINPWLDKSRARNSLVFSLSPNYNKVDLTYYYSNPSLFGFYTGIAMYNITKDIDDMEIGDYMGVGQNIGINLKTIPYTWLLLGLEYSYGYQRSATDPNWSTYYDFNIGPQIGLNFIINNLDISTKVNWLNDDKSQVLVDVGLGFAL
jgi:hypothetical protein